jgi:hypothetical protein
MDTILIVAVIVIIALAVAAVGWWLYSENKRNKRLAESFGPEYERALQESGSRRDVAKELEARRERVEKFRLKDLSQDDQRRYADEWHSAQARFVDDPAGAIKDADRLVIMVMDARGYPMEDFDQRAADVSVEHPQVVQNYRAAHVIAEKNDTDGASTEELRPAMVYSRSLFEELLGATPARA